MKKLLCRLGFCRIERKVMVADHDGTVERHTCSLCGEVEEVRFDIAGERLARKEERG